MSNETVTIIHANQAVKFVPEPEGDHILQTIISTNSFYERDLLNWLCTVKIPDGLFLDVGGFIGNHSLFFNRILKRSVLAIEANPASAEILRKNALLNDAKDLEVVNCAAGASAGKVNIVDEGIGANQGAAAVEVVKDGQVKMETLDKIYQQSQFSDTKVALIKIDVEGFESDVIRGAQKLIDDNRPMLLIECLNEVEYLRISEQLDRFEYLCVSVFSASPVYIFAARENIQTYFGDFPPRFQTLYRLHGMKRDTDAVLAKIYRQMFVTQKSLNQSFEGTVSRLVSSTEESSKQLGQLVEGKLTRLDQKIAKQLSGSEADLTNVDQVQSDLEQLLSSLREENSALYGQYTQSHQQLTERLSGQDTQLDALNALAKPISTQITELQAMCSDLLAASADLRELSTSILSDDSVAQSLEKIDQSLQENLDSSSRRFESLEVQLQRRESENAKLSRSVTKLSSLLQSELNAITEKISSVDSKSDELMDIESSKRIARYERQSEKAERNYRDAVAKYETTRNRLNLLENSSSFRLAMEFAKLSKQPIKSLFSLPKMLAKVYRNATVEESYPFDSANSPTNSSSSSSAQCQSHLLDDKFTARKSSYGFSLTHLKVACIMDEFTYTSYKDECETLRLTPENYRKEIATFEPDLVFVESAWSGNDGLWKRQINYASKALCDMLDFARERGIPTVFWNKEDPVHFDVFINTAKLFDGVFTTDLDSIPRYKTLLGHEKVFPLLFAAQTSFSNPIEKYDRQHGVCFAGAYYKRYPERNETFEKFVDAVEMEVSIYDRNYHDKNPDFEFPKKYQKSIKGNLPFAEIDKAYKGYEYNFNMNSVTGSQTMFARRVYELLACNTVALSNFSVGVRKLFGDLVISTNDPKVLRSKLQLLTQDQQEFGFHHYRKLRLAALRKTMMNHTYEDRLAQVVEDIGLLKPKLTTPRIAVVVPMGHSKSVLEELLEDLGRQSYRRFDVFVVSDGELQIEDNDRYWFKLDVGFSEVIFAKISERAHYDGVSKCVPGHFYGENFFLDIALARRWTNAKVIGKGSYFSSDGGELRLKNKDLAYREGAPLSSSASVTFECPSNHHDLASLIESESEISDSDSIAIDEFNYCDSRELMTDDDAKSKVIDAQLDTGITLREIRDHASRIEGDANYLSANSLNLSEIFSASFWEKSNALSGISAQFDGNGFSIESSLAEDKHCYLARTQRIPLSVFAQEDELSLYMESARGVLDAQLVLITVNNAGERVNTHFIKPGLQYTASVSADESAAEVTLRVKGSGTLRITKVITEPVDVPQMPFISSRDYLILTNQYPEPSDIYRNAFVHTRAMRYAEKGVDVDVFRLNIHKPRGMHEFEDINCHTGSEDDLYRMIAANRYQKILVHFLDESMWRVLSQFPDMEIMVWLHGSEIQPWYRREYNYTDEAELAKAKIVSDQRMEFWREIFTNAPNIQYIFVSHYFADEVIGDVGIPLPADRYLIIPNYTNTKLFNYVEKTPEQRFKFLSIRPYASRKYANDLTVEAILKLSEEPEFEQMEFALYGDGVMFDELLEPLRKFSNVHIHRGFLTHQEIAELHKSYGIFLTPTRMDAQGVSRDEAMSSGLIPVTNAVAAIPEFVDDDSGLLAGADDSSAMAERILEVVRDPKLFSKLSSGAAKKVRSISDYEHTILREVDEIKQ